MKESEKGARQSFAHRVNRLFSATRFQSFRLAAFGPAQDVEVEKSPDHTLSLLKTSVQNFDAPPLRIEILTSIGHSRSIPPFPAFPFIIVDRSCARIPSQSRTNDVVFTV